MPFHFQAYMGERVQQIDSQDTYNGELGQPKKQL